MSFVGMIDGIPAFKLDPKGDVILFVAGFWDAIPPKSLDELREVSKPKEMVISEKHTKTAAERLKNSHYQSLSGLVFVTKKVRY